MKIDKIKKFNNGTWSTDLGKEHWSISGIDFNKKVRRVEMLRLKLNEIIKHVNSAL